MDSDYRTQMHPSSSLRYDGSSRLWTARLLRQEDGDALARDELFFQLPLVPPPGKSLRPWDEDELEDIFEHSLKFQPLLVLLDSIIKYERKGPIQVRVAIVPLEMRLTNRYQCFAGGPWSMEPVLDVLPSLSGRRARSLVLHSGSARLVDPRGLLLARRDIR